MGNMKRVEKLARTNKEIINYSKPSFIAGFVEGYKQAKYEEVLEPITYIDKDDGKEYAVVSFKDYQDLRVVEEEKKELLEEVSGLIRDYYKSKTIEFKLDDILEVLKKGDFDV